MNDSSSPLPPSAEPIPELKHPEPVEVRVTPLGGPRASSQERFLVAFFGLLAAVALGVAYWLPPDPRGHGTHQSLGLPPCGFVELLGIPCPSCGMTTAFAHGAKGEIVRAFLAQPAGAIFFLAALAAVLAVIPVSILGYGFFDRLTERHMKWITLGFLAMVTGSWIYKIWRVVYS